ncbi:MAG: 4Fe-4S binding protein, partial [Candidatus Njordarchaeota archaeon]
GIDIRAFGKGFEEFYKRARKEGIKFIVGVPSELREEDDGTIIVEVYDATLDRIVRINADLVVLESGYEAGDNIKKIAEILKIPRSADGFILERHPKLDPYSTTIQGIFVAGVAQGPKDIPDSVAQAGGAAAGIMSLLSADEIELEPFVANIDQDFCSKCEICYNVCPYNAIEISFSNGEKMLKVKEGLCAGCGVCVSSCPTGAISIPNMDDKQYISQLEAGLGG